jgi:hypothetical protein
MGTEYTKPTVTPAWGELNQTAADMVKPSDAAIQAGWPESSSAPVRQYWNWVLNYVDNGLRYLMQRGLVDWDAAETYSVGSRCIGDDGNTYVSLIASNINNAPSASPTDWAPWALSLAQINASQLTQTTQAAGDSSTKVATTQFVTLAIGLVNTALTAAIAALAAQVASTVSAIATYTVSGGTMNNGSNKDFNTSVSVPAGKVVVFSPSPMSSQFFVTHYVDSGGELHFVLMNIYGGNTASYGYAGFVVSYKFV